jgi:hypothetical protein
MSTWALTITAPSDIGYPDDGFSLPPLNFHEIVVECEAGETDDGQLMLIPGIAQSLIDRRRARRNSLEERCEAAAEIANADPSQCLVWCDLNDESAALAKMIDGGGRGTRERQSGGQSRKTDWIFIREAPRLSQQALNCRVRDELAAL